jgi:hypothetical protein
LNLSLRRYLEIKKMTHQECTNDIRFNYDVIGRKHKVAKIAALAIIDKSKTDPEAEIKRLLQNPEIPADSVKGGDYAIYVIFNKFELTQDEKVDFRYINESLSDLELDELFFF